MVVEKDIVAISIPFSAGVITAALLPPGGDALYWAAAGSSLAAAGLLLSLWRCGDRTAAALSLFFLLGFCTSAAAVPGFRPPRAADEPASGLLRAIERAGFPHASTTALLRALLAGRRDALSDGTVAAFRAAGASHLLALSGLHLGILYGIVQRPLTLLLGRSRAATGVRSAVCIGAAAAYLTLTGTRPSLMRAFLFICLGELSRLLPGRRRRLLQVLCAALTLQLCLDPTVVGSLGFQLSYLAMLGIALLYPRLEAWYPAGSRWDPMRRLWRATALTLSCQAFTAPLVWVRFHSFPKYFLLTNLCALPLT